MAASASLSASLTYAGKKHILVLSELRPEDAGEVRFQAGPAQSVAQLEVEGKLLGRNGREWASSSLPLGSLPGWRLVLGMLPPCLPASLPRGTFHLGRVSFLGRRRLWGTEERASAMEI